MKILVLNSGSSSQKACLYEIGDTLPDDPPVPVWQGRIESNGDTAAMTVKNLRGVSKNEKLKISSRESILRDLLATSWSGQARGISSPSEIDVVGHRVVHGGVRFQDPVLITNDMYSALGDPALLAPLHIQSELEGMKIVGDQLGDVPQFAIFDTGFHRQMPLVAQIYTGPYQWFERGIRRYGFHGINHQYCATRAAQLIGKDLKSLQCRSVVILCTGDNPSCSHTAGT